ncbi:MAG: chorismate mutase [Rhodobacteraceae bacterium]|nr:chorismate mutase [Paracoccaceae bacterium]
MTEPTAQAAEILQSHRESIDRLDSILIHALGERFKHTRAVGQLKARHHLPPSDPTREAQQMERLESLAKAVGLDPRFAQKFLRVIIAEVVEQHQHYRGKT